VKRSKNTLKIDVRYISNLLCIMYVKNR